MPLHVAKPYNELMSDAKEAEEDNDFETAAKIYERAIRQQPHEELPYNRLMIAYRKLYKNEDELGIIQKGIAALDAFYKKKSAKMMGKHKDAQKLSKSLAKSLGLIDKKGADVYHPEPIAKWLKRQAIVEKKLGKK